MIKLAVGSQNMREKVSWQNSMVTEQMGQFVSSKQIHWSFDGAK